MSRITASAELSKDELQDAPEEEWLNTLLEHDNELARQVVANINQNLPILDSPTSKLVPFNLVHGASVTIKNPLSVPIRSVMAVACVGLSVDSTGKPTRGTYNLGLPQIEWHPSGKEDGSVVVTANYPAPSSGSGSQGEYISSYILPANAIALTNNIPVNVGSVTLTPGAWDISVLTHYGFGTGVTGTLWQAAYNTVSATMPTSATTAGDSLSYTSTSPTAAADTPIVVPARREVVTVATPYYSVARALFSVGSPKVFGRISAVRAIPYLTGTTGKVTLFFAGGN